MFTDANDVPTVRDLIANGNPTAVSIGDSIWIQPGTKNSLYNDVIVPSTALLPVVQDVSSSTHAKAMVLGFGPFMITASVGGSSKYIEGHFVAGYQVPIAAGGGPAYGAFIPRRWRSSARILLLMGTIDRGPATTVGPRCFFCAHQVIATPTSTSRHPHRVLSSLARYRVAHPEQSSSSPTTSNTTSHNNRPLSLRGPWPLACARDQPSVFERMRIMASGDGGLRRQPSRPGAGDGGARLWWYSWGLWAWR